MYRVAFAAAGSTAAAAIGGDAYLRANFGEDATKRLLIAYRTSIPAFAAYRWVQFKHETAPTAVASALSTLHPDLPSMLGVQRNEAEASRMYEELHGVYAAEMRDVFLRLRGFYIKTGQLIANNIGDGAPEHWRKTMEPLLDHVPHKPFAHVRATVESELGARLEDIFESFNEEPIAAASIGQVHKATLRRKAGGDASLPRNVVVKVMYPEVEAQFRGDVSTAKAFMSVALPEHLPAMREIEKQFASEFDYRREAEQLAAVRANLKAASPSFDHIYIPAPVSSMCTKSVLVMEEVPHVETLGEALQRDMDTFAELKGVTKEELIAEDKRLNKEALERGELRSGPSFSDMNKLRVSRSFRNNLVWPLSMLGFKQQHVPLNHAWLTDELLRVHGHQIFINGAFNADPHPGNILISYSDAAHDGASARVALVDYGQVKKLTNEQRLKMARLTVALARAEGPGDEAALQPLRWKVAERFAEMGFKTKRMDKDIGFKSAQLYFSKDDKVTTGGKHVQEYIESLQGADPIDVINDDYVMVARCALMLRGLGHALNQHRSSAQAWLPFAERVMREAGEDPNA